MPSVSDTELMTTLEDTDRRFGVVAVTVRNADPSDVEELLESWAGLSAAGHEADERFSMRRAPRGLPVR